MISVGCFENSMNFISNFIHHLIVISPRSFLVPHLNTLELKNTELEELKNFGLLIECLSIDGLRSNENRCRVFLKIKIDGLGEM